MKAPVLPYNRSARARNTAGLTIGQAARLLGISRDDLAKIEAAETLDDPNPIAALYRVRVEWLTGEVPRRDYASVDKMNGAHRLTTHDRDAIAEFAASIPRGTAKQLPNPDKDDDAKA